MFWTITARTNGKLESKGGVEDDHILAKVEKVSQRGRQARVVHFLAIKLTPNSGNQCSNMQPQIRHITNSKFYEI